MRLQKYLAELIGTFTLTLAVGLSIALQWPVMTPLIAGLTVGLFVYTVGGISGAHLNPAITLALASLKKISLVDALGYIIAQVLGALAAMALIPLLADISVELPVENTLLLGVGEALGAFFLAFGIAAVVHGKVSDSAAGLTIGGSLFLGILIAAGTSNGILNPAVAIGLGSISVMYLLAPIVGAVIAMWLYRYLQQK